MTLELYLQTLKQKRDRLSGLKAEAMKELAQLKGCLPAADCQGSVVLEDVNAAEDMVSVVSEGPDAAQELGSVHDMKASLPSFCRSCCITATLLHGTLAFSWHRFVYVGNAE